MKARIGIMTYYAVSNYGAVLQAFALQQNLRRLGTEVEFLRFYDKHNEQRPSLKIEPFIKRVYNKRNLINERLFHRKRFYRMKGRVKSSGVVFKSFRDEYLNISREPYYDLDDLKNSNFKYDAFIAGSDMVWTPIGQNLPAYYLEFADQTKRLSYAASMTGCMSYSNDDRRAIADYLRDMRLISCREQEGIDYVKELTGKDSTLTLDPTLLLTKDEWCQELELEVAEQQPPYILCYMFGGVPKEVKKNLEKYAVENNLQIRYIPQGFEEIDNELNLQQQLPYNPREFVELFFNASFVVTNSFHGMIFSLIGETPFIVYHREKNNAWKSNETRISNLLAYLGIGDRFIETNKGISSQWSKLDYTAIKSLLEQKRETSLDYLKLCVSIAENNVSERKQSNKQNNIRELSCKQCWGCGLCAIVCPQHAINTIEDEEGFLYPVVDSDKCIECGLCAKKCPSIQRNKKVRPIETLLCVSKDKLKEKSASGGIFVTIAKYIIEEKKGVVFGCILDENFKCRHTEASCMEEIEPMQNSKYIQSDVGDCYKQAKRRLDEGRYVLFTGTPCQVSALKSFIGKDHKQLFTIELICHGVPNLRFWSRYISKLNEKEPLLSYSFRNRSNRKLNKGTFESTIVYQSKIEHVDCYKDPFYSTYVRNESFRQSCYYCQYARNERSADITIGDCDTQKEYQNFYPEESKSSLLLNNDKGISLWESVKERFEWTELDYSQECKVNTTLLMPSPKPVERDVIYKDLNMLNWKSFVKKYVPRSSLSVRVLRKVVSIIK